MTLSPALGETLEVLAAALAAARDQWWIIGSAAAALHGAAPIAVRDVDVLLSVADAQRLLPGLGLDACPGTSDGRFQSEVFGSWTGMPLMIEFMAGLHYRTDGGWKGVSLVTRQAVTVGRIQVHVPRREELIALFEAFGRPKDRERARLLARPV